LQHVKTQAALAIQGDTVKQLNKQKRAITVIITVFALVGMLLMLPEAVAATPEPEQAEPTASVVADSIIPFDAMSFVLHRVDADSYFAAIRGHLDPEVVLPATVEIALPAGTEIIWFGEASDDGIESSHTFEYPYDVRTEYNLDIYTVTLTSYHNVQIEYNLFINPAVQLENGDYIVIMEYTPLTDLTALSMITNLPVGSTVHDEIDRTVEFLGPNAHGESQFGQIFHNPEALQPITLSVTYSVTTGQETVLDGLMVAAAILIGIALVTMIGIIIAKRRQHQQVL